MILADTSVWIAHMRRREPELVEQLATGNVAMHPMVLGELACGNIGNRQFMGRGIGFVDAHLLCAALGQGIQLWTRDLRLREMSVECGVAFMEMA